MNNTAIDNLVEWIFNNKEIFNSNQYLEIMNLAQKLVVSEREAEDIENYEIILHLNNYRLPNSDSEAEEEDEDEKEDIEDTNDSNILRTSDAESSDDEEDFSAYTGSYIDSY